MENNAPQTNLTKQILPNSTAVLVLGILSIISCWCYGIIGLLLSIIALILASKGTKLYKTNPELYTEASYKNLNAGKICAIIGVSISGLYVLIGLIYITIAGIAIGTLLSNFPWEAIFNNF